MKPRPEHATQGDPCKLCHLPASQHRIRPKRPEHPYEGHGVTCLRCHLSIGQHVARAPHWGKKKNPSKPEPIRYAGIDGEGQGAFPHRYTMLAASDEHGEAEWYIEKEEGLGTHECLDFLIAIPLNYRVFAYGFNYDLTMILRDLPNELLYYLFRPEMRKRSNVKKGAWGPRAIAWEGYLLNLQGTKFTVKRVKDDRERVIWDIWKFYQSKFTAALKLWKVGEPDAIERMAKMKAQRGNFDAMPHEQVRAYCLEECRYMASLASRLVDAHEQAGLTLKSFYGAGSSASAMLDIMKIRKQIVPPPEEMREAIACAFSGGRFENSVVGKVNGPIHSKDISSAYPYQLCFLPCLVHARWQRTRSRKSIDTARTALVRYKLRHTAQAQSWGPFPFRTKDGSICYPQESGGGWVWRDEYLAGERLFPNVQFIEAWICYTDCECQPFARIPDYYKERLRIGKTGSGIVIKLAMNSNYGKLAQSVGVGVFQSWVWAGLTTSGCRAQILDVMARHKDLSNLLMVATDGIQSREDFETAQPNDTGTSGTGKPLGGWESDTYDQGVFYARPGIYFPLQPTSGDIESIRARGIGKAALLENWQKVIETWEQEGEAGKVRLATLSRFGGAKTSISRDTVPVYRRSLNYGEWLPRPTDMTFAPMPKRQRILPGGRLEVRRMPLDLMSAPYDRAIKSNEALELEALEMLTEEQPDLEFLQSTEDDIYE